MSARYVGGGRVTVGPSDVDGPAPGEVQVAVAYTGLCGTDLHVVRGHMDRRVTTPAVLGHEMSGTVAAVGERVEGWSAGAPVSVMPLRWDGSCPACRAGHRHVCQNLTFIGIDSPGALQTKWNVPAHTLVALPPSLRLDHAALAEPLAVAVHDVRRAELTGGEKAVVVGGGPIGVLIAMVARHAGAEVAVVEPDRDRRHAAGRWGFTALDPGACDLAAWVEEWTGTAGADVVFEASGAAPAVLTATSLCRVRGRLVVVAIHPEPRPVDLHRVFWRELNVLGTRVYERADFEEAVALLARGAVPAKEIITRVVPISRAEEAFAELGAGRAMKILVDVAGGTR